MIADDSLAGTQEDLVLNLCALFLNILKTLGYPKQRILYWDEKKSGYGKTWLWEIDLRLSQNRTEIALSD